MPQHFLGCLTTPGLRYTTAPYDVQCTEADLRKSKEKESVKSFGFICILFIYGVALVRDGCAFFHSRKKHPAVYVLDSCPFPGLVVGVVVVIAGVVADVVVVGRVLL